MKTTCLCGALAFAATTALAQTSVTPPVGSDVPKTISVSGCVVSGSKADSITLTQAMVLPLGSTAGVPEPVSAAEPPATVSPEPTAVSAAPTQPPPTPRAEPRSPASAVPGAVGTSGTIAGTAPAGSSASTMDGYRLSGMDMAAWVGRRVQIFGTLEPPQSALPPVAVDANQANSVAALRNIRVTSVQPVTGPCKE